MFSPGSISPPHGWGSQKPPCGVPIDRGHPLARGLALALPLNEKTGQSVGSAVPNRLAASLVGCAWKPSSMGTALTLNGSSDYMDAGPASWANFGGSDFCIAVWAAPASIASSATYFYAARDSSTGRIFAFAQNNWSAAGAFDMIIFTPGGYWGYYASYAGSMEAGKWSLVAVQRRGSVIDFYINGRLLSSGANIGTVGDMVSSSSERLSIGRRNYTGAHGYFAGQMGPFYMWGRSLSSLEHAMLRAEPYCMFEAGTSLAPPNSPRPLIDGSLASDTPLLGVVA